MEDSQLKERAVGPETPSTPLPVRPSLRSTSDSSTGAFVFAGRANASYDDGSPDLLSTSPPYPDPTSLPTSPGFETVDPNIEGEVVKGGGSSRNASDGSSVRQALAAGQSQRSPDINNSPPASPQRPPLYSEGIHSSLILGQGGTLGRSTTIRSISILGRVGLSPSLDLGRRRGASEGPEHDYIQKGTETTGQELEGTSSGMHEDSAARRSSLSGTEASWDERGRVGSSKDMLSSQSERLGDSEAASERTGSMRRIARARHSSSRSPPPPASDDEVPDLPSPPPELADDQSEEGDLAETYWSPVQAEEPMLPAEEGEETADGPGQSELGQAGMERHHSGQARIPSSSSFTSVASSSRRVRPKSRVELDNVTPPPPQHTMGDTAHTTFSSGMPRSTSSSSSLHRTIKATSSPRPPIHAHAVSSSTKRHSLSYTLTHSRSSSHTSTTLSSSPEKRRSLAVKNGESPSKNNGKGKGPTSDVSPRKASKSLWEDIPAGEADGGSDEDDIATTRAPEREGRGDELDERIRLAEEKIRLSALARSSRPRSSLSLEPEDHDSRDQSAVSPAKSQLRQRDPYRRHVYTPSGSDTLRRSATLGSAERRSAAYTPVKREPADWAHGLEQQGAAIPGSEHASPVQEQRESAGSSGSGKRKPLPAEFRQSGSTSLFTPSPKAPMSGLPNRQAQYTESPTSVKSNQSRFLDSPSRQSRDSHASLRDQAGSTTPSSRPDNDVTSRSGSQYSRRQWSESISGLPSRYDHDRASSNGLPSRSGRDRRPESVIDTIRDRSNHRSNPSTLSSRAPLTPGDSVSAVGVPPYAHATGQARGASMMPPHAQSEVGFGSARKDKDPLDVIRRMEQSRDAANRQWEQDRAASVLGHSTMDTHSIGQRPASRAGYAGHVRAESRTGAYARPATSMSGLREVYEREAPRTAPVGRHQSQASRAYGRSEIAGVPGADIDSPLAQRRMGKHISLAPSTSAGPRHMRSSTSLGGRSSTSAFMGASNGPIGNSQTAHGRLLLEAASALEGRLPVDGEKAVELVKAVRGSAVSAEAANQLIRDLSHHLANDTGDDIGADERERLVGQLREASKKSDLTVRELTRVLLDLPRLLREVQAPSSHGSRQDNSSLVGTGDAVSRYTPSRLSVIRDDSYRTGPSSGSRLSRTQALGHRLSVDSYASSTSRPQSVVDGYSRYTSSAYAPRESPHDTSPTRMTAGRTQTHESPSPSKGMRASTSLGGFVARLRSPRKDSLPVIDDAKSSIADSPEYDARHRGMIRNGSSSGRSALDLLRSTSVRDSSSRMRQRQLNGSSNLAAEGDMTRGTQSMDVPRTVYTSHGGAYDSPSHNRYRSHSPSKESMASDHTATTATRSNGYAKGEMSAGIGNGLRKKTSIISTNTVRAVSGFAPGLMGKLPPATPATTAVSNITAGDISPTAASFPRNPTTPGGLLSSTASTSPSIPTSGKSGHSYRRSADSTSRFAEGVRDSLEEVEPSSPMSRYGLAHAQTANKGRVPDLARTESSVSYVSENSVDAVERDMRTLGLGRPASRAESQATTGTAESGQGGLDKSRLARLTSWRLKR